VLFSLEEADVRDGRKSNFETHLLVSFRGLHLSPGKAGKATALC
jgi:hypothetical protein